MKNNRNYLDSVTSTDECKQLNNNSKWKAKFARVKELMRWFQRYKIKFSSTTRVYQVEFWKHCSYSHRQFCFHENLHNLDVTHFSHSPHGIALFTLQLLKYFVLSKLIIIVYCHNSVCLHSYIFEVVTWLFNHLHSALDLQLIESSGHSYEWSIRSKHLRKMKIFVQIQKNLLMLDISPSETNRFNWKIAIGFLLFNFNILSIIIVMFTLESDNLMGFVNGFCIASTLIEMDISFAALVLQQRKLFKFIEITENIIARSNENSSIFWETKILWLNFSNFQDSNTHHQRPSIASNWMSVWAPAQSGWASVK